MSADDGKTRRPCAGTIVIVEDDEDVRETLREFLEDHGFRVATAADGVAALALLREVQACFILLDLVMPVMDGWTFLREREKDAQAAQIPLCISTSAPDKAPPGFPVIAKPVDVTKVLDAVRQHC